VPARIARSFPAVLLALLMFVSLLGPATAQEVLPKTPEGKIIGHVIDGRGRLRAVRKFSSAETSFYSLVGWFYTSVFNSIRTGGDEESWELWKNLRIEPYSPEARSVKKAALRAEALYLDIPILPSGLSDEEFLEAQYRNKVQEVGGLLEITLQMLRELRSSGYPLKVLEKHIDEKVRQGTSATLYGDGEDEYYRKFLALQEHFAREVQAELKPNASRPEGQP
jgi:hypothetical protein